MFRRMHLKQQVVFSIMAVQLLVLAFGAAVLVANARNAVAVEIGAGERSARALVIAALGSALQDTPPGEVLPRLADILVQPRHVDLSLIDAQRGLIRVREVPLDDLPTPAPAWFTTLVWPEPVETRVPVQVNGRDYGYVSITTAPADEIAEVWADIRGLFWIIAGSAVFSAALLSWLVHRALRPLGRLRTALKTLQDGDLATRIRPGRHPDLAPITEGFNALSASLQTASEERASLNRRIVELADAERRAIAMELHDEFGPCLFGLKVKASAIARASDDPKITADAGTILEIVSQIQASNARLLTTLRPMAIGQLPLTDALRDLFEAFRKTHPGIVWHIDLPDDLPETPEIIDLTVYRFFQEGTTNALRHGTPQNIRAGLTTDTKGQIHMTIEDDGPGIDEKTSEGRGLTAMRDRIGAVGGQLTIDRPDTSGTRLKARFPLSADTKSTGDLSIAS
ncbi:histidine kinase [Amaricoccus tamworthensis]|uniref:histidine kinase n=1 Tax=Amaricoccus tamworthensis TaxID=57002 RepID=UPI003C79CB0A